MAPVRIVVSFDFRHMSDAHARNVGDAVERPGAKSPKRNGKTASAGTAAAASNAAATPHRKTGTAHGLSIGPLPQRACRRAPGRWKTVC